MIVRGDGRATYNFANPVEDMDDGITHVIRGSDHVSNTPKQLRILAALGHEPPVYAHVPDVLGSDGKKLSKRHGATAVDDFRIAGYLPEALMNFIALLGWAPDGETTIMSPDELVERFTLDRVGSSPATFDYEKLDWMNGVHLRALPQEDYAERLIAYLREQGIEWPEERVRAAAPLVQEKIERLGQFPEFAGFLFEQGRRPRIGYDAAELDPEVLAGAADTLAEARAVHRGGDRGRRCGHSPTAWARSRGRHFSRSGSPSPDRRFHPGCSRASSCWGARKRSCGSGAPTRQRPRPRQRIQGTLELPPGAPPEAGCRPGESEMSSLDASSRYVSHFKVRTARRGRWLRTVRKVAGRDEREPDRPYRPEHEHGARGERGNAGDGERGGDRGGNGKAGSRLGQRGPRRADREPDAGEADTEQRATPLEQHGRGCAVIALERVGELAGCVARVDERVRELGVRVARARRRLDPGEELARPVQPVLERPQSVDHVRVQAVRVGGERLETAEGPREPAPEARHRAGIFAGGAGSGGRPQGGDDISARPD